MLDVLEIGVEMVVCGFLVEKCVDWDESCI